MRHHTFEWEMFKTVSVVKSFWILYISFPVLCHQWTRLTPQLKKSLWSQSHSHKISWRYNSSFMLHYISTLTSVYYQRHQASVTEHTTLLLHLQSHFGTKSVIALLFTTMVSEWSLDLVVVERLDDKNVCSCSNRSTETWAGKTTWVLYGDLASDQQKPTCIDTDPLKRKEEACRRTLETSAASERVRMFIPEIFPAKLLEQFPMWSCRFALSVWFSLRYQSLRLTVTTLTMWETSPYSGLSHRLYIKDRHE